MWPWLFQLEILKSSWKAGLRKAEGPKAWYLIGNHHFNLWSLSLTSHSSSMYREGNHGWTTTAPNQLWVSAWSKHKNGSPTISNLPPYFPFRSLHSCMYERFLLPSHICRQLWLGSMTHISLQSWPQNRLPMVPSIPPYFPFISLHIWVEQPSARCCRGHSAE